MFAHRACHRRLALCLLEPGPGKTETHRGKFSIRLEPRIQSATGMRARKLAPHMFECVCRGVGGGKHAGSFGALPSVRTGARKCAFFGPDRAHFRLRVAVRLWLALLDVLRDLLDALLARHVLVPWRSRLGVRARRGVA